MNINLSVIIASYNHQDYIASTLESLEKQTYQNFEIIMIDDGSTDNTVDVAKHCPSRARIFEQHNQGVVAARNKGISLAKGKYICFVDSDDIVLPERFAKQTRLLDTYPQIGLVYADALIIDSNDNCIGKFNDVYRVKRGDAAEMLVLHYCFTPMITVMVRTDILKKTGPYENPGLISDYMKWIEIAHLSKVFYDPEPLGCWRRHTKSTSLNANKEIVYAQTRIALRKILEKHPALKVKIGAKIKKRISRSYFLTGFFAAVDGNIKRARIYYFKALKTYPCRLENWGGILLTHFPYNKLIVKVHRWVKSKKLPW